MCPRPSKGIMTHFPCSRKLLAASVPMLHCPLLRTIPSISRSDTGCQTPWRNMLPKLSPDSSR